jgi:2-polyprenyl-3-methyl-5-hydroxy-6-metoxy-1,4-benzoquinol methylase
LDIGAATGEFLSVAREYDLSVSGIEISSHAAARAKEKFRFIFHETSIVDYLGMETYDLIHMNHVFEHFRSPHKVLERIDSLLQTGGLVYVEVPFQFNLFEVMKYQVTGKKKDFDVFSLHHPIFYRPTTLRKVFDDHGFNCRSMKVFNWSRYPANGLICQIKRAAWFAASLAGQGIMIEAIFDKKN